MAAQGPSLVIAGDWELPTLLRPPSPTNAQLVGGACQRGQVLAWGVEAIPHGGEAEVGGTEIAPAVDEVPPLVRSAPTDVELWLQADEGRIATGLTRVAVNSLDGSPHLLVRLSPGEPTIAHLAHAAQRSLDVAANPDRDRTL